MKRFDKSELARKMERALGVGMAGMGRTWGTVVRVLVLAREMG